MLTLSPFPATTPGIELPRQLSFRFYQPQADPRTKSKSGKQADSQELLLHSSEHHTLEYTGTEEVPRGSKPLLSHYVGIYDPTTGTLEVIEAKKMVVRGQVRSRQEGAASAKEDEAKRVSVHVERRPRLAAANMVQSAMERKTDLGQTFGTKKAKKAIRENVLNAIAPLRKAGEATLTKMDDAARAMLGSVGAVASQMATREELQAVVNEAKPVPKANLEATSASDVYDAAVIIGADILNLVPIREWQEKARRKEGIQVPSRFVAARINALAVDDDATPRLRILRYLDLVLRFLFLAKDGRQRGTKRVPSPDKLRELMAGIPDAVVENIRRKFSDAGMMRKFHVDLLMTHCCAFALLVDRLEVCTKELREDLKLGEDREMNQFFHEVGARVKRVKNKELGQSWWVAKLQLPLEFPKQRQIAPRRR